MDLDRGGHVVRWEYHLQEGLSARISYRLAEIQGRWLPVSCQRETFQDPKGIVANTPSIVRECRIDPSSVRFDQGLSDAQMDVQFPDGTYVNDMIQSKRYYVGGRPPQIARKTIQKHLEKTLELANEQANERVINDPVQGASRSWLATIFVLGGVLLIAVGAWLAWRSKFSG
jgi:hypothetical protein